MTPMRGNRRNFDNTFTPTTRFDAPKPNGKIHMRRHTNTGINPSSKLSWQYCNNKTIDDWIDRKTSFPGYRQIADLQKVQTIQQQREQVSKTSHGLYKEDKQSTRARTTQISPRSVTPGGIRDSDSPDKRKWFTNKGLLKPVSFPISRRNSDERLDVSVNVKGDERAYRS